MPLLPNALERLMLFTFNQAPSSMLDAFGPVGLKTAMVAADLGIFDSLEVAPATPAELAEEIPADEKGLRLLLDVLSSFGYVRTKGEVYSNTRQTSKWLLSSSPGRALDFLRWWQELVYKFWDENLEVAIREGEPSANLYEWISSQPNGWEIAQAGFEATARLALDDILQALGLPSTAERLLDLGGGHGLYSIELCRRNPRLRATIFDLPEALGKARDNVESAGLADRVEVRSGNYLVDDLGGPYSTALLFNVIHAQGEAENARLLERVRASLERGGRVYILDQMGDAGWSSMMAGVNRILALAYHVGFRGRTYSHQEVSRWLLDAGYEALEQRSLLKAPGTLILSAARGRT